MIDLDSLMLGTFGVWILIITCFSFTHSMSIGHAAQDLQKLSSTKDKAGTHLNFHITCDSIDVNERNSLIAF